MIKTDNDSKQNKTVPESAAERAFNFRPLLFAAVFFVLGIVFSFSVIMYDISPWLATLALPIAAGKIALSLRKKRAALIFLALALCFGVGYARFNGVVNGFLSQENYNGAFSVCGVVQERYDYGYKQKLVLVNVEFNGAPVQGKAVVFTDAQAPISLSSELCFSGNVSTDLRLEENGRFRAEAVHQTLCYQVLATSEIVVTGEDFELFRFLRERVFSVVYAGLDESVASVAFAILTGETSGMDFSLLENVRFGGVAHLFAVSGLHVGALYGFCTFLLERGKGYRVP
ncbi:MAG: ComEC/Rec2 family competence protein, partial [Clostridia bacterium]|nr:ComEC/Rec2 family competence protein [Clostridia bacterium]